MAEASKIVEAAKSAAGSQEYPAPALYVVATPIGNLADITLRAIHVLALVDAVACEDTRLSGALLRQFGIAKPLIAAHRHNERSAADAVLQRLGLGERVAFVSDAGTPALSDPGAILVTAVRDAGHRVLPIPGASAALAALSVAGDTAAVGGGFAFDGFVDARGASRKLRLSEIARAADTRILFEAPHRIASLLDELAELAPERTVTICRELTKQFETIATLQARALPKWLACDANNSRGEFVLVLHARPA
ncbi:MAG: 16S rRNA (cytidine(1402)-2'-O)-methyltransferase, partial [Pseudomonadota bacterium]|nr:16S rRNA (cytidine(1402)-2'-O)-methyltransferase [Pseudomonadota bacterium]